MKNIPKHMLFDFDGTFANTNQSNANAYYTAITEFGFVVSEQYVENMINGRSWQEFLPDIIGVENTKIHGERISKRKHLIYSNALDQVMLNQFLVDFVKTHSKLFTFSIVTNSRSEVVSHVLKNHKMYDYFKFIVTRENFNLTKPSSDPYITVLKLLGAMPFECIAVEDTMIGAESSTRAGITTLMLKEI